MGYFIATPGIMLMDTLNPTHSLTHTGFPSRRTLTTLSGFELSISALRLIHLFVSSSAAIWPFSTHGDSNCHISLSIIKRMSSPQCSVSIYYLFKFIFSFLFLT